MAAFNKLKLDSEARCRTVTCLPHGRFTVRGSLNVSCLGSRRSLQLSMHFKQIYETSTSQTDEYGKKPHQLIWWYTKRPSGHCTNMLLTSNEHTQSTLSSPMSGLTQSHQTNNTIATILQKVWQDLTHDFSSFLSLLLFLNELHVSPPCMICELMPAG